MGKLENFIHKAKLIHGDKYDYSNVEYSTTKTPIKIICPIHGEFEQQPRVHLTGSGCKKCHSESMTKSVSQIINEFKEIHGDKYDYSKVNYTGINDKVIIICPKHGEFEQTPSNHKQNKGCPKCGGTNKLTNKEFIEKAKIIHGDKYDYSKVYYVNNSTKVIIICQEHGEFEQQPNNHLQNKGCPKCYRDSQLNSLTKFILSSKSHHGDKYDYSKVEYVGSKNKVTLICPEHGEFEQTAESHIRGFGCLECANDSFKKTNSEFINEVIKIHGDKYDYSKVNYINNKNKVTLICPKHGEFEIWPKHIRSGQGCPKCNNSISKSENDIVEFIKELNINIVTNDRTVLNGKELDIYIPSHKLAIEFNGLYWHSELHKDKNYHIDKTNECEVKGIQLIHIFEDEWLDKQDIVKSRLKNLLGLTENKIYARKCEIKEVPTKDKTKFLNDNHIQGSVGSKVNLGLYHNNELVSIMTFGTFRVGFGYDFDGFELSRFCNKLNSNVIGGASKLLKHFIKRYKPNEIRTYADRRWSTGNLYNRLGFNLSHVNKPNYQYIIGTKRNNRFNFRKSVLVNEGFDSELTEHQIMLNRGIYRIYDCGTLSYKLKLSV